MAFDPLDASDLVERMPWLTRVLLRCLGRRLNRDFFAPVLMRDERQVITSHQLHALHRHFDPTQRGTLGRAQVYGRRTNAADHGSHLTGGSS